MPQSSILSSDQGGGGGEGGMPDGQKTIWTTFYFSPQLTVYRGVQWFYYKENCTFPRIQRGSNILQEGGGGGGSKC